VIIAINSERTFDKIQHPFLSFKNKNQKTSRENRNRKELLQPDIGHLPKSPQLTSYLVMKSQIVLP
jgi:hypothetical protein